MTPPDSLSSGPARAFPTHPRLDRYFPSAAAEDSRSRLIGCVERGEGPAVLIGSPGAGKTMLLEVLSETFRERFTIAHLAGAQLCTRRALLQSILHAFELPYRDREEGELRLSMMDFLRDGKKCPGGALLLVDEAEALPLRLLEELRVLGNVASEGEPLVRLVMAGTTKLEEHLAAPEMEALNQRIAARAYLSPLTYDELVQYMRGHIAAAGANPDELLSGDAAAAVFEATDGIPRLVNQLCDRAIVLAVEAGAQVIDRAAVQNAWSDLHQLPAPWHSADLAPSPAEFDPAIDEPAVFAPPVATDEITPAEDKAVESEPAGAVWNADAALAEIPSEESAIPEVVPSPLCELESIESTTEPLAESPVESSIETTPEMSVAVDPFGETFEEEETVLDPYAGVDSLFPPGTPIVTNQEDITISTLVAKLAPTLEANDEAEIGTPEISAAEIDEPEAETPAEEIAEQVVETPPIEESVAELTALSESLAAAEPIGLPFPSEQSQQPADDEGDAAFEEPAFSQPAYDVSAIDIDGEPAVLLIEEEAGATVTAPVRRQEYRRLFASLRGT